MDHSQKPPEATQAKEENQEEDQTASCFWVYRTNVTTVFQKLRWLLGVFYRHLP